MKTKGEIEKIELPIIRAENGLTITRGTAVEMKLNEVIDRVNELSSLEKKEEVYPWYPKPTELKSGIKGTIPEKEEPTQEFTKEELEELKLRFESYGEEVEINNWTKERQDLEDGILSKIERLLK